MRRLAAIALPILFACSGDSSVLTVDRSLDPCEDDLPPACGTAPRCSLDTSHYVTGTFPGGRQFVVHTDGAATLNIQLQFSNERSPGTDLLVKVHESDCSNVYTWDSGGVDLFRKADQDGIIAVQLTVSREGDHPVEITCDAYTDYLIVVDVGPTS